MNQHSKSWALWIGILLIIAACVFAYINTRPSEANLSMLIRVLFGSLPGSYHA